ncbi:MAG TPA: peptidoglycan DD-metalloendopeptidase family protein [Acidimicrobiales bacterium]|nr:peptidoglycan DD-metalloendopeptidase family protein [Acidimicrobiales bacterium]
MARRPPLVRRRAPARLLVATLAAALAALPLVAPPAAAEPPPVHVPPVSAPVVDPFRAPAAPWAPGNRGLEYGTDPGTEVSVTADGVVVFAGTVAGAHHVTVHHADDVRTTYAFLDEVRVVVGQRLHQGDVVGTTQGHLHLGARRGDAYFDPASLFAAQPVAVRLVPFDIPPGLGPGGERSAVTQLVGGALGGMGDALGWVAEGAVDRAAASTAWMQAHGRELLRTAAHYAVPIPVRGAAAALGAARRAYADATRPCTSDDVEVAPPADRRLAIRVGGLGSTSESAAIDDLDLAAVGYEPADVARFSYQGGTTPSAGASYAGIESTPYDRRDSQADLWESGRRLAELIEAAIARSPTVPLDLYAHSQGGLVVRAALVELARRHPDAWFDHLGVVVTLGTPHHGADLATAAMAVNSTAAGGQLLAVGGWLTGLDADAPSAAQLAETSDFIHDLDGQPLPAGVEVRSIAARGDLVVPVPRTVVDGAEQVVVPVDGLTAHDQLPGSTEAGREVALAVGGLPPGCLGFGEALLGHLEGEVVSLGEDTLGSSAWGALAVGGVAPG